MSLCFFVKAIFLKIFFYTSTMIWSINALEWIAPWGLEFSLFCFNSPMGVVDGSGSVVISGSVPVGNCHWSPDFEKISPPYLIEFSGCRTWWWWGTHIRQPVFFLFGANISMMTTDELPSWHSTRCFNYTRRIYENVYSRTTWNQAREITRQSANRRGNKMGIYVYMYIYRYL